MTVGSGPGGRFVFWWVGRTVAAFLQPMPPAIPENALTWRGEALTWRGEILTWR